jgi:membrane associated rhomboid family serine protease
MLIPIRTESPIHRTPWVNYALITVNVVLFIVFDMYQDPRLSPQLGRIKMDLLVLHPSWPHLHQFVTYQFFHGDLGHLLGNMLFLWVFGNSVNAKMGHLPYALFYIACGMFSGWGFGVDGDVLLGASGSIAAVTTAYLVLFPRSHITVMYVIFFIGFFEIPAMLMIGLKIILYDNIIAPRFGGPANVAYSAHLVGYAVGFGASLLMLLIRALPRDQFDMLALMRRWNQRRAMASAMAEPGARARAKYGSVARTDKRSTDDVAREEAQIDAITDLRTRIGECLEQGNTGAGAALYEQLVGMDDQQCLSERAQLTIAREFYATGRSPQGAAAFEQYLRRYPDRPEDGEIRLLLGIILARDLGQLAAAEKYLSQAVDRVTAPARRELATQRLKEVREQLGRPPEDQWKPPAD